MCHCHHRKGQRMKPYYQDDWVTIYHGAAERVVPELFGYGTILTDPPYGLADSATKKNNYLNYDDTKDNLQSIITNIISPLIDDLPTQYNIALTPGVKNMYLYPVPSWVLCWSTSAGTGCGPWGFCCWQPILVYGGDPFLREGKGSMPDLIEHTETAPKNGHPCPKPLGVWRKILRRVSPEDNGPILDPFMGSGTTLRVAKDINRKAIGIEIEEKYCEMAANRMSQEVLEF